MNCDLHFKKSCPISEMYWNFLNESKDHFEGNHRMLMPMRNLAKKTNEVISRNKEITDYVRKTLSEGRKLEKTVLLNLKSDNKGTLFINPAK